MVETDAQLVAAFSQTHWFLVFNAGKAEKTQAEASRSLLTGSADYLILHDNACVYARLADSAANPDHDRSVAVALLRQAVDLWRKAPRGPDEGALIDQEVAFSTAFRLTPE